MRPLVETVNVGDQADLENERTVDQSRRDGGLNDRVFRQGELVPAAREEESAAQAAIAPGTETGLAETGRDGAQPRPGAESRGSAWAGVGQAVVVPGRCRSDFQDADRAVPGRDRSARTGSRVRSPQAVGPAIRSAGPLCSFVPFLLRPSPFCSSQFV